MNEKKLSVILEALASQIESLENTIYILKHENGKLREENKKLKADVQYFIDALKAEEVDGGLL